MRRRFVGVVVSDKMDKTRVVITERMERLLFTRRRCVELRNSTCMTRIMPPKRRHSSY